MRGANAASCVAMIVFVEEHEVLRSLLVLKAGIGGHHRAAPVRSLERKPRQAFGKQLGYLTERQFLSGSRRVLDEEILAVIALEFIEGFDEEIIDRHPYG